MFCPQCGKEYADRVNFCCQCGATLSVAASAPRKKLMRSRTDHKIAGVCGGFAEYFDLDSTVIRICWLIMAVFAGWGVLGYLIAWIAMPEEPLAETAPGASSLVVPQPSGNR